MLEYVRTQHPPVLPHAHTDFLVPQSHRCTHSLSWSQGLYQGHTMVTQRHDPVRLEWLEVPRQGGGHAKVAPRIKWESRLTADLD